MSRNAGIKLSKKEKMNYKVLMRAQKMPVHSYRCHASTDVMTTESAPVYPGDTTYVYVPVQNMGFGTSMSDVSVRLEPIPNRLLLRLL